MVLNPIQIAIGDIYYFFCLLCLLRFRFHFLYLFNQSFKSSRYFQVWWATLLPRQSWVLILCRFCQHQSTHMQKYFRCNLRCSYPRLVWRLCQIFITGLEFHRQWNQNWIVLSLTCLFPKGLFFRSIFKHTFIY